MIAIAVYMHTITDLLRVLLFTRTPVEGVGDESGGRGGALLQLDSYLRFPHIRLELVMTQVGMPLAHDTGLHASWSRNRFACFLVMTQVCMLLGP